MSILKNISDKNIFDIFLYDDKKHISLTEPKNWSYSINLNKKELSQFISELQDIHNKMKEE